MRGPALLSSSNSSGGGNHFALLIWDKESVAVEKIWLKSYPLGVPAEINPDIYQSIIEIYEASCKQYADRPAFYNLGVTITYAELNEYSRIFAAYLQSTLQLKKGSRFAIMLPNTLQYPIALFGALRAGLIVVNVNPLYSADELAHQLNDSETESLIVLSNFANVVEKALPRIPKLKNIIVTELGDLFPRLKAVITYLALKYIYKKIPNYHLPQKIQFKHVLSVGKNLPFTAVSLRNTDPAFLQYTGGTTGISKGAVLTHRNIIANILQAEAWFDTLLKQQADEIIITALPLYHIFSLLANCLFFSKIGGLNVLITNPRDIPALIKEMRKFKFTSITGVNTLFNAMLKDPDFASLDFSHLWLALGGGMAVQRVVAEKWQLVTGKPLIEAYGLTETSPCVSINPINDHAYNGSIGLPVPSTDVCIFDEDGNEVSIGQAGELAIKGPQVMEGYWQNPTETAKVFNKEGWLLTGDIASIDGQGFLRLLERKKDMIIVSGFNVYPNEIEDVVAQLPGVNEVAVVGIPDERSGEAVKAYVIKDQPNLTAEEVIEFAREHLTPYKVPKQIEFCKELPKTNVGKILRRALKTNKA